MRWFDCSKQEAEHLLYEEIAHVTEIPPADVIAYIENALNG